MTVITNEKISVSLLLKRMQSFHQSWFMEARAEKANVSSRVTGRRQTLHKIGISLKNFLYQSRTLKWSVAYPLGGLNII